MNTEQPTPPVVVLSTALLERMRAKADNAYCAYIAQLGRDECLGWEIKVERGKFGKPEIEAHCKASELLGRHRALHEAAEMVAELMCSNAPLIGTKGPYRADGYLAGTELGD